MRPRLGKEAVKYWASLSLDEQWLTGLFAANPDQAYDLVRRAQQAEKRIKEANQKLAWWLI